MMKITIMVVMRIMIMKTDNDDNDDDDNNNNNNNNNNNKHLYFRRLAIKSQLINCWSFMACILQNRIITLNYNINTHNSRSSDFF